MRKDYETLSLSRREAVAALPYAPCSIHLENTLPPEKEMNVTCFTLLFLFVASLCSTRISGHASAALGRKSIYGTSFCFPLWGYLFGHAIPACSRTETNECFGQVTVYLYP